MNQAIAPTMKAIASAFVKSQRAFGPALKTNTNPHFRNKYADLAACVEAVIDALNQNGIALVQQTHESESGVTVETTFLHESGEILSAGRLYFPASKNDAQGFMSALTYARRGSLMAACGIAPEDDDGNAAAKKQSGMAASELADWIAAIGASTNQVTLKKTYIDAIKAAKNDEAAKKRIIAAKNDMKAGK